MRKVRPNNLKSAINKACRYEPEENSTYADLARHYGCSIIPARPYRPKDKAFAERFVRSVKEECLGRMIFLGRRSLERALSEYIVHYHGEHNHQGLGNCLLDASAETGAFYQPGRRRQRLGGMLSFYRRAAAA